MKVAKEEKDATDRGCPGTSTQTDASPMKPEENVHTKPRPVIKTHIHPDVDQLIIHSTVPGMLQTAPKDLPSFSFCSKNENRFLFSKRNTPATKWAVPIRKSKKLKTTFNGNGLNPSKKRIFSLF